MMATSTKVFVGNLPPGSTEVSLCARFSRFGNVVSVKLVAGRGTRRNPLFAFVEMATLREANRVVAALLGTRYDGWVH